jgi:hypothetical protein|tara:strand:- start:53 stop:313 length:261 start_codon:yes stop_codon:yes gene_type:complete
MALTKENEINRIEVVTEYKHIQVRTDTVIKEDGKELSRAAHRHVIHCNISDEDLAKEHADVQAVANSGIWTQAVKDAYTAKLAKSI